MGPSFPQMSAQGCAQNTAPVLGSPRIWTRNPSLWLITLGELLRVIITKEEHLLNGVVGCKGARWRPTTWVCKNKSSWMFRFSTEEKIALAISYKLFKKFVLWIVTHWIANQKKLFPNHLNRDCLNNDSKSTRTFYNCCFTYNIKHWNVEFTLQFCKIKSSCCTL